MVVNRSVGRAEDLVRTAGLGPQLRAASLGEIHRELARADVVLAAVAAESHVLTAAHFSGVAGPMLVIDLGVPRNVDPVVGTLPRRHPARHGHPERVGGRRVGRPPG